MRMNAPDSWRSGPSHVVVEIAWDLDDTHPAEKNHQSSLAHLRRNQQETCSVPKRPSRASSLSTPVSTCEMHQLRDQIEPVGFTFARCSLRPGRHSNRHRDETRPKLLLPRWHCAKTAAVSAVPYFSWVTIWSRSWRLHSQIHVHRIRTATGVMSKQSRRT